MKEETREIIYLAGLLHDIGKFYQRADDNGANRSKELSPEVKQLEQYVCRKSGDFFTHKHVLWTAQFIDDINNSFKENFTNSKEIISSLLKYATYHHNPSNFFEAIIQEADHLSSGIDRTSEKGLVDEKKEKKWDDFKRVKMVPILESVVTETNYAHKYETPITHEKIDKLFYPKQKSADIPDYKSLWVEFMSEVNSIKVKDIKAFSETFFNLICKYTSTVPSSVIHLPDVSLYDHLKTSGALAVCLYDYANENEIKDIATLRKVESPILLVGADISGIQNYLYSIASKNASKNLKGRSFYLQMLCDSIIEKIIGSKGLNLYKANVVYNSGGGFYLLAPNTQFVREKVDELSREIESLVLEHHGTSLYVAIDSIEVGRNSFFDHSINESWKGLFEKLNQKKRNRYSDALISNYNDFFNPIGTGNEDRDVITNEEILVGEKTKSFEKGKIKGYTFQQIEIGKWLNNAMYWVIATEKLNIGIEGMNVCGLGIWNYLLNEDQFQNNQGKINDYKESVAVYHINSTDFVEKQKSSSNIKGYVFYGGNNYPVNPDATPKTFDKLCEADKLNGNESASFTRLGVLRMDIDNLGIVFQKGFTNERRTFSRYSSLSRSLDFFFRGYINKIWDKDKYRTNTYILYSGGDDLFIIGKWDKLIDMAYEIRNEFSKWCCHNPNLTLSGGVALVTAKYPILRAAEEAGEAESLAKQYDHAGFKKNAFTLFNYALHWENDLPVVEKLKNRIKKLVLEQNLPHSFISRIMAYYSRANFVNGKITSLNILWLSAYDLGRMAKRYNNQNITDFLDEVKEGIYTNKFEGKKPSPYHFLELLYITCRWCELELR